MHNIFRANNIEDAFYIINNLFTNANDIFSLNEIKIQFRGVGLFQEDIVKCILLILTLFLYSTFERSGNVWSSRKATKMDEVGNLLHLSFWHIIYSTAFECK